MNVTDKAINPKLLPASRKRLSALRPVTSVDIYDGATKEFHPNGLFSTEIFGRLGSPERIYQMSYIDIRVKVFNPVIFKHIEKLKGLYVGIMSGKQFAVWNAKLGDFERVNNELEGRTGFAFFLKHFKDIKFKKTGSDLRNLRIELIKKYETDILRDTCVVTSAGSRDIIVGEDGRESRDEINDLYSRLIAISNTIIGTTDDGSNDAAQWNIQRTMVEIYDYLAKLTFGKKKRIQGTFASRRVFNSTRNVITSMPTHSAELDSVETPPIDSVMIGLWQHTKASLPITQHYFLKGLPSEIIDMASGNAVVFDSKMQPKNIQLGKKTREYWATPDGVNRILNDFGKDRARRSSPVMVDGQYFAAIYRDSKTFRLITASEVANGHVPERYLKAMKPVSWVELIYALVYRRAKSLSGTVTRYPVTGGSSIYPAKVYLKSTTQTEVLRELDRDFKPYKDDSYLAFTFPSLEGAISYFDSFSPHPSSLVGLGADFDGDTITWTCLYGKQAVDEQKNFLDTKDGYFDPAGGARLGVNSDLIEWFFRGMTLNNGLDGKRSIGTEGIKRKDMRLFFYSTSEQHTIKTAYLQRMSSGDEALAEKTLMDVDNYNSRDFMQHPLKGIELLFGEVPDDINDLFPEGHMEYSEGETFYIHEIDFKEIGDEKWEVIHSPEEMEYRTSMVGKLDVKNERDVESFKSDIAEIRALNGYIYGGGKGLEKLINKFTPINRATYVSASKESDPAYSEGYGIPKLIVYPTDGTLKVRSIRKITF